LAEEKSLKDVIEDLKQVADALRADLSTELSPLSDDDMLTIVEKAIETLEKIDSTEVERSLTIKMKGRLQEINNYCEAVGELSNRYDLEVEF